MNNVLLNKEVLDPKDQTKLFILGFLGHDYCQSEMKEYNTCESKLVSNRVDPEVCIKQADKLTNCFFRLKESAPKKCPQELERANDLSLANLEALKNCVLDVKESK